MSFDDDKLIGLNANEDYFTLFFFSQEMVDHETNKKKNQDREARERLKRLEEEKKQKANMEKQKADLEHQKRLEEKRRIEEEKARLDKAKKDQEAKELEIISGNFAHQVELISENRTNLEMTFSGQDIPIVKMRIIFKALEGNTSLRELVINRKGMSDEEGCDLSKSLEYNHFLERLSLEGNMLGPRFLEAFAKTLKVNKTLKYIDLEGNTLCKSSSDSGVQALCEALKENDTVTYLSLNNCQLSDTAGKLIERMLLINKKITMIDLEGNPKLSYEMVRSIQDRLVENRNEWNRERKREWNERKELTSEETNIRKIVEAREEEIRTVKEIQAKAQDLQLKREQIFVETLKKQEDERRKLEKKLEKEALMRAKNKRRGGSPKKK